MTLHKPALDPATVEPRSTSAYPEPFRSRVLPREKRALGDALGLTRFGVNLIPYTLAHTTWGDRRPGDLVNLEVDLMARYLARLRESERLAP